MNIPGSDLLARALTVIAMQSVTYRRYAGRTTTDAGKYVAAYDAPTTLQGSFQPIKRRLYQAMGLDLQKNYANFYVSADLIDVQRGVAGDQIIFLGRLWQCESLSPWFGVDGWVGMLVVDVGPAPVAPYVVSATIGTDGRTYTVVTSADLTGDALLGMSLSLGGGLSGGTINGTTIIYQTDDVIYQGETVTRTYDASVGNLTTPPPGMPMDSFTDASVVNNSTQVPVAGCAYPLTGDQTLLGNSPWFSPYAAMTVSGDDSQTASYTMDSSGTGKYAAAVPVALAPFTQTTGLVQVGVVDLAIPFAATNQSPLLEAVLAVGTVRSFALMMRAASSSPTDTLYVRAEDKDGNLKNLAYPATLAAVWFVLDLDARKIRVWLDEGSGPVEQDMSGGADDLLAGEHFLYLRAARPFALGAGDVGKTVSGRVVTSAAEMPFLAAGATDPCGSPI